MLISKTNELNNSILKEYKIFEEEMINIRQERMKKIQ